MDADFVVAVRAGTVSCAPYESEDGALLDLLPFRDKDRRIMSIAGRDIAVMLHFDEVAIAVHPAARVTIPEAVAETGVP